MENGRIDAIIDKHQAEPAELIQILLDIQHENRWLPMEALERVSERLDIPLTRVQQTATFYKAFTLTPKGQYKIHVCTGTACHVRGSDAFLEALQEHTGIRPGETDLEQKFSLETVNCLGCCSLGPVMEIDDKKHGKITPAKMADVLKKYE